jgi:hypothetical protein
VSGELLSSLGLERAAGSPASGKFIKSFLLSAMVVVFSSAVTVLGQDENHWERYESRTLSEVIGIHRDSDVFRQMDSDKKAMLLTGDDFASQVKLVYLGKERKVSDVRAVLLNAWRKSFKDTAPPEDEFTTEFLFKEGSEEHWLVVQKSLVDAIPKELKKGAVINAYVIWIGAIKAEADWEWLFAMNEFVACPDPKQSCSL